MDAKEDGYRFVQRTIDEWLLHINSFSKKGEVLYGISVDDKIVAIGGLNIDPFLDDESIGRVRHLYVHRDYRENGFSKVLLKNIIRKAKKHFTYLRLSTTNEIAAELYEKLGFERVKEHKATHSMKLKK
jgi:ribosomal protein S18 acetylase RimI-like enzyme